MQEGLGLDAAVAAVQDEMDLQGAPAGQDPAYRVTASEDITAEEAERLVASGEYKRDPETGAVFRVVGTEPAPYDRFMAGVLAAQPGFRPAAGLVAGAARGVARVAGGAYGLLGQAADRLGLDGIGNAMIDQANAFQGGASRINAPFRNAALRENQIGQLAGEVAATVPLTAGVGAGVGAVGRGVATVAPRTGSVISRIGTSIGAGGFTPSVVGRPVAGAVAPPLGARAGNLAVRGVGGATAGGLGAAVINEDDATMGAAIGAALPTIAARPAKWALNRVLDTYQRMVGELGEARAATIVRNALGIDLDRAVVALQNAAPDVTAQQALVEAGVPADVFMAVGEVARAADPRPYRVIADAQDAARQARLTPAVGGVQAAETAAAANATRAQQRQAVATQAGQRRISKAETAAQQAQRGGEDALLALEIDAERAAEQSAAALTTSQRAIDDLAGGPTLTASRLNANEAKTALRASTAPVREEALAAAENNLDVEPVVKSLMAQADAPGVRADPDQVAILGRVASQLKGMADLNGGVINPHDLYRIRQRFISAEVGKLLAGADPSAQKRLVAELTGNIAPLIDNAVEAAGGARWGEYLSSYSAGMRALERQELMGEAARLLRQSPARFRSVVRGDDPDFVRNIFGGNNIDLADVLEPAQFDALQSAARVLDEGAAAEAATAAQTTTTKRETAAAKRAAADALAATRARVAGQTGRVNAMAGNVEARNAMALRRAEGELAGVQAVNEGELARDRRVGTMAAQGAARARELMTPRQSNTFRRTRNVAAFKGGPAAVAAMDFGAALIDTNLPAQTKRALAQAYQSGANMEQLLRMVPLADRAQVARNLMDPRFWLHLQGAAINTMASPDEQGNAMSARYSTPEDLANSVEVPFPE